jgi:hypothetical protein
MKRHVHLLAFALAIAGMGYSGITRADDITIDPVPFSSTKSRDEVRAELDAYRKAGVNPWSMGYNPQRYFHSTRTREEVTAEYIRERDAVAAMTGEDSGSVYLAEQGARGRPPAFLAKRRAAKTQH